MNDSARPASSRRMGPADHPFARGLSFRLGRRRALVLRAMAIPFAWPLLLALFRGAAIDFVSLAAGMALLYYGSRSIDRGLAAEAEGATSRLASELLPPKLLGSLMAAGAALLISYGAAHDSPAMAVLFAALTFAGSALAYGLDGKLDRTSLLEAAKAAGVKPNEVLATLEEARRKIADIEAAASRLHSRELKSRVARIVEQARMVLALVERKPSDLGRARRFFVTYLDGTRDVVARYAEQQHDVADTPLGQNFRRVLTTIEQVLDEQQEVLRRDDKLDLEVKIEVLETQLRREGVH
jgi:5-bromo-4-chloroindolyl phosphate hydrolysis protein